MADGNLTIPFDPQGLEPKIVNALDDIIVALQTWAGRFDGFGRLVDVPYEAGFFRAVTGTWTVDRGDVREFSYAILQDLVFLRVNILNSTTSAGMGNDLRILLPAGLKSNRDHLGHFQWNATGAALSAVGVAYGSPDGRYVRLLRDTLASSTAWPSSETNSFNLAMTIVFPLAT